jgi:hypothetical protein
MITEFLRGSTVQRGGSGRWSGVNHWESTSDVLRGM